MIKVFSQIKDAWGVKYAPKYVRQTTLQCRESVPFGIIIVIAAEDGVSERAITGRMKKIFCLKKFMD